MDTVTISLWQDRPQQEAALTVRAFDDADTVRPALLIVPGGGYRCVCRDHEGVQIAERFADAGFRTFILDYRVAPNRFPAPQQDILRAVRLIRFNSAKWRILPDNIAVCGFSAGGHLAASAGIIRQDIPEVKTDSADQCSSRPDAMVLCYPVITSGKYAHRGSFRSLLGGNCKRDKEALSLEKHVSSDTPPAFIWHTMEDSVVPPENSLMLAKALRKQGVAFELHLFPRGGHGLGLARGRKDVSQWPEQAAAFLADTCGFTFPD